MIKTIDLNKKLVLEDKVKAYKVYLTKITVINKDKRRNPNNY